MRAFRHREDRVPVALFMLLFCIDVTIYVAVDAWQWLAAWTIVGILFKTHVCAWNHHHQHVPTFETPWLNRALEVIFALQTGVTSHTWVLHHALGHHVNYLDQRIDEARWRRADGTTTGPLEFGLIIALTAYGRALQVGRRYPRQRRIFVLMGIATLAVVAAFVWARPLPALFVFVLPMGISCFLTALATHAHHTDKPVASHFVASNNILHRGYNLLTGNLGYHTAHHYRPGVHWSKLPALHAEIEDRIPDDCYLTPGFPWRISQTTAPSPRQARAAAAGPREAERVEAATGTWDRPILQGTSIDAETM